MKTLVISMGGTPLKRWSNEKDKMDYNDVEIFELLKDICPKAGIEHDYLDIVVICSKESDEVNYSDMVNLYRGIEIYDGLEFQFIVICGNNKMAEIANKLKKKLGDRNEKKIFFVGGNTPVQIDSVPFTANLTTAVLFIENETPGVYIVTNPGEYEAV